MRQGNTHTIAHRQGGQTFVKRGVAASWVALCGTNSRCKCFWMGISVCVCVGTVDQTRRQRWWSKDTCLTPSLYLPNLSLSYIRSCSVLHRSDKWCNTQIFWEIFGKIDINTEICNILFFMFHHVQKMCNNALLCNDLEKFDPQCSQLDETLLWFWFHNNITRCVFKTLLMSREEKTEAGESLWLTINARTYSKWQQEIIYFGDVAPY